MSKDNITYEIVEKNEENPLQDKLVKKNVTVEFTMEQLDQYTHSALKQLDQYRGQLNIEDAKQKNVEEHHEDAISLVRELDPVKQNAILIWLKAKEVIDMAAPRRDELEEALKEHEEEIKKIKKQTGWEAPKQENHDTDKKESEDEEGGESDSE